SAAASSPCPAPTSSTRAGGGGRAARTKASTPSSTGMRSAHLAAGRADLVERAVDVARRGGGVEGHREALAQRVERGRADAVVGRQAGDRDAVDPAIAQQRGEVGAVEARVA